MIGSKHKALICQLAESRHDVRSAKMGAIAADHDDLVITKAFNRHDRILEALGEVPAGLPVPLRARKTFAIR